MRRNIEQEVKELKSKYKQMLEQIKYTENILIESSSVTEIRILKKRLKRYHRNLTSVREKLKSYAQLGMF